MYYDFRPVGNSQSKVSTLKRLVCIFSAIIVVLTVHHNAFAAEVLSLAAENTRCTSKGAVQVDIVSKSRVTIYAFTLEIFCGDPEVEFVKADKSADSKISRHSENGTTKLVYYCKNGKSLAVNDKLFTLHFKSESRRDFSLSFSISQCVNSDAEFIDSGGGFSCNASFADASANSVPNTDTEARTSGGSKTSAAQKPSGNKPENTSVNATFEADTQPYLNSIDDDSVPKQDFDAAIPIITGGFSVIIAGLSVALALQHLSRKRAEKQNKLPRDSDGNNE